MNKTENSSRVRSKLVKFLISILFALFILEVFSRVWLNFIVSEEDRFEYSIYSYLRPDNQRYIPHHYLNYYLNPKYKMGKVYHNSLGYRDNEFSVKKPEEVFRIVAIGGSSTYTIRVNDNEKTFTSHLDRILQDKYGYNNVVVINAGVGGYNSWESLINLQFRVIDLNPNLVIVYHGTNDIHARFVDPASYKSDNSGRRKQWRNPNIPILEHSVLFRILLRKSGITAQVGIGNFVDSDTAYNASSLIEIDPFDLLKKNPPKYFKKNLNNMVAVSRANGVEIMFATWAHSPKFFGDYASYPHYEQGFKENNEVVKEVAKINGIPLFDFASKMPDDTKYWADGRHVNEFGAEKKAELFAEFIHNSGLIQYSE